MLNGMNAAMFADRVAVLATMHRKEQVIAPILEQALGLRVVVPAGFDTDAFGTFTREVPRPGSQLETARRKVAAALDLTGETVGLASEGSFGPHPAMPWLPCGRELVVLIDRAQGLELVGEDVSTQTNFSQVQAHSWPQVEAFAQRVGFPEHGLVVVPRGGAAVKGITDWQQLAAAVDTALVTERQVQVETDMRALYNPTRLEAIARATADLVRAHGQRCPQCGWPGFAVVERRPGLPCGLCQMPTSQIRLQISGCQRCGHREEHLFPDGVQSADPALCPFCNP